MSEPKTNIQKNNELVHGTAQLTTVTYTDVVPMIIHNELLQQHANLSHQHAILAQQYTILVKDYETLKIELNKAQINYKKTSEDICLIQNTNGELTKQITILLQKITTLEIENVALKSLLKDRDIEIENLKR